MFLANFWPSNSAGGKVRHFKTLQTYRPQVKKRSVWAKSVCALSVDWWHPHGPEGRWAGPGAISQIHRHCVTNILNRYSGGKTWSKRLFVNKCLKIVNGFTGWVCDASDVCILFLIKDPYHWSISLIKICSSKISFFVIFFLFDLSSVYVMGPMEHRMLAFSA